MKKRYTQWMAGLLCAVVLLPNTVYAQNDGENKKYEKEENTLEDNEILKIDEEHFPDAIFREYVSEEFDVNKDNVLSQDELNSVREIQVSSKGVSDLTGIEYFVGLNGLRCYDNNLTELDVSKNINLSFLSCGDNLLEKLDLSHNVELRSLSCSDNQLSDIDVKKNTKLRDLRCENNQLSSLDLSNNADLWVLECEKNKLTNITFNPSMDLDTLMCGENLLTTLDISQHTDLRQLGCNDNELKSLDISGKSKLEFLECGNNQLTSLDVSNSPLLYGLLCSGNALKKLDVSHNPELVYFWCADIQLTDLDVSQNKKLLVLWCSDNRIKKLDVSQNVNLYALLCSNNQLEDLDVSNNVNLDSLLCDNNNLSALDLQKNTELGVVNCQNNHLSELNAAQCKLQDGFGVYVHGKKHYDYDNVLSQQTISATANRQDKQWTIDLSKNVSSEALAKISVKEGDYDSSTGIWVLPEGAPRILTYTILTGKKTNKSNVEEDLYMDVEVNVEYNSGDSSIIAEIENEKVSMDINGIDTDAICNNFKIDPKTSITKVILKQTEADTEKAGLLTEQIKADGNVSLDTYDVNMSLYVDGVEKGEITEQFGELTLNFYAGIENKGKMAMVYQLHGDEVIPYKNLNINDNGMIAVTVTKLSTFAVALQTIKRGDIDENGEVNLLDLMLCLNHVSKKNLLEGDAFSAADIDGNKMVNLLDLMQILNYVSKKSATL